MCNTFKVSTILVFVRFCGFHPVDTQLYSTFNDRLMETPLSFLQPRGMGSQLQPSALKKNADTPNRRKTTPPIKVTVRENGDENSWPT